jgi:hypothetical protein
LETQHQKLAFSLLVTSLLLIPSAASAQTLIVVQPDSQTTSVRLSDLHGGNPDLVRGPTDIKRLKTGSDNTGGPAQPDGALQTTLGPLINATPGTHFDGMSVYEGGYIPSDNNIAVGPNHVVETVNAAVSVYTKGGTRLMGPTALRSMWTGLGGNCAANNGGDPIVQYDKAADRWMITQLGSLSNPYSECIAVSQTNDPTGAYNLYSYAFGSNLNDYPKFGVWPTATNSAYLATYNLFANGASFAGPEICAYDRQAMLAGAAATALCYTGIGGASFLPADLDGATPPVDGTPGYFLALNGSTSLRMYKLAPNFAAATATLTAMPNLTVTSYSQSGSVPQPGTTMQLDSLSDRAMYRLAFRMFGDHETMVMAHSVVAGTSSGVRWYEIRSSAVSTNPTFSVFQQGTFAPDSNYRWMGSAAMDQSGDIAIGYSAGSSTLFPSVRYTGRTPGDAAGTMESEASIKEGAGSQTGYSRWGDYSSMRIDPSDDCTFWYANEYLPVTSSYGWYTHIGSFKFSGCGGAPAPDFSLSANPTTMTVAQGGTAGTSTVTVTALNGFSSSVTLSVSGCPVNATCSVSPSSLTPTSTATLSVTAGSTTPTGTISVTVTGTGSTGTHTATVSVTVQPPPDFSLSASPSSVSAAQGQVKTSTITVGSIGGFNSAVGLTVSGCPAGTTCALSSNSVTAPGSSTLTITTTASTPLAGSPFTITISGNGGTHTTTVSLTVTPAADFGISVSPTSLTVKRGSSGTVTVNTTLIGGSSSVALSISALPSKVSASFTPSSVTAGGSSTLKISTLKPALATSAPLTLTITGNNGTSTQTTTLSLTITN